MTTQDGLPSGGENANVDDPPGWPFHEVAALGTWQWDPEADRVSMSEGLFNLMDTSADRAERSLEEFVDLLRPDDRSGLKECIRTCAEQRESFELQFRYRGGRNEDSGWLWCRGKPDVGPDESVERVVGTVQDITSLKKRERGKEGGRRYLELLFDLAPLALIVSSPEGIIRDVNRTFEQDFGFSAEEAVGSSSRELGLWVDDEDRSKVLVDLLAEGQVRRHQTRLQTAEGEHRDVEISVGETAEEGEPRLIWALRDVTERNHYERKLEEQALFDSVTGLPNRDLLLDRLEEAINQADESGEPVACLFVDLDDFKAVNDQYGHAAGDELLRQVGQRLEDVVRGSDTVARIAGDEFVLVLEGADASAAKSVSRRLLERFEVPFSLENTEVAIGASVGIAVRETDEEADRDGEDLLRASDTAMYRVKKNGADGFHLFGEQDRTRMHRLSRRQRLSGAIDRNELVLYYQPIVDLLEGGIRGAEALVRWDHPDRGLVSPAAFIPFAEETGLIGRIDQWVLRAAVDQVARWRESASEVERIRVNVTPHEDLDESFQFDLLDHLDERGVPGHVLELEITERMALEESDQFDYLRERGVRLAIDDFGTGYSSLFYLQRLEADTLKIDPFFTREIQSDGRTNVIVDSILDIADRLGMDVIAECVETEEQRRRLQDMGCPLAQGFLFARPMPVEEFETHIAS